ncbi:MAG: hypothetical protein KGQ59_07320 [Bdellovibrionales bacterium]|nr:hypothetical protein [Bdellovibrionales bacterium]
MIGKSLSIVGFLLALTSCSTMGSRKSAPSHSIRIHTPSWIFSEKKVTSEDYGGKTVTVALLLEKKTGQIIRDFTQTYPAFEWTIVSETEIGTIATLDHTIEGRSGEVPILFIQSQDKEWSEIVFSKAHFSGEVIRLKLLADRFQLRISIDSGLISRKEKTGSMKDTDGNALDFQDWTYLLKTKNWMRSSKPLVF